MITDAILDVPFGIMTWLLNFLPDVTPIADATVPLSQLFGFLTLVFPYEGWQTAILIVTGALQVTILRTGIRWIFK